MTSTTTHLAGALPATTTIGRVRLRVGDLDRELAFYRDMLGFNVAMKAGLAELSAGPAGEVLIALREAPGIGRAPRNAAGLYHFAILLPSRADLARFARHLAEYDVPFGQSDHTVSEALYFDDPDGNGIEVYADRPRTTWPVRDGIVHFTGDPIDFEDLFATMGDGDSIWHGMPAGTAIGHVHLRVSDVERSQAFYERLGFRLTADFVRGARFVGAGGYHHHLGMNMWESRGRALAPDDVAGLDAFTIVAPGQTAWADAVARLGGEPPVDGVYRAHDPDGIPFDLVCDV